MHPNENTIHTLVNKLPALLGALRLPLPLPILLALVCAAWILRPGGKDEPVSLEALASKGEVEEVDWISRMRAEQRTLLVIYGTETGTAKSFATRFAREMKSEAGISSLVVSAAQTIDEFPVDMGIVLFLATFGEGEPTSDAEVLFRDLCDPAGPTRDTLRYAIFGLGNSTYEHFNGAARSIDAALETKGGTRICRRGEGDDDGHIEADFNDWLLVSVPAISATFGGEAQNGAGAPDFVVTESPALSYFKGELSENEMELAGPPYGPRNRFLAPIETRQLFALKGERACIHASFDTQGSCLSYAPGDHLAVWPRNPSCEVNRLLALLGLANIADTVIEISALDDALSPVPVPQPTTYRVAFTHYLDISAPPRIRLLHALIGCAPTAEARKTLESVTSDDLAKRRWSLSHVLRYVSSEVAWSVPFDILLTHLDILRPRYYSISSSLAYSPDKVDITAVLVRYRMDEETQWRHGLSTGYLHHIHSLSAGKSHLDGLPEYHPSDELPSQDRRVPIHLRATQFRLPRDSKTPVIMIGPGTGVAPFRGFVQERVSQARKDQKKGREFGDMLLYYGCRRSDEDYLYASEWPEYARELPNFKIRTAFSREGKSKVYVQDLLRQDASKIKSLILEHNAHLYVCGDAGRMARDVELVLSDVIGKEELQKIKSEQRLRLDVW